MNKLTRRSLLAGAAATPVAAVLPALPTPADPLDQYRVRGWKVMWNGYDAGRFADLYRVTDGGDCLVSYAYTDD